MTHAIETVFIDAILGGLLRELGLPETFPLIKLSPRMQEWIVGQAEALQRDAIGTRDRGRAGQTTRCDGCLRVHADAGRGSRHWGTPTRQITECDDAID
jgi:hypothetical protein